MPNNRCFVYIAIPDRETAIRYAIRMSLPGDIILFAGKGHETYQLIAGRKIPFRERSIIQDECAVLEEKNEEIKETRV